MWNTSEYIVAICVETLNACGEHRSFATRACLSLSRAQLCDIREHITNKHILHGDTCMNSYVLLLLYVPTLTPVFSHLPYAHRSGMH